MLEQFLPILLTQLLRAARRLRWAFGSWSLVTEILTCDSETALSRVCDQSLQQCAVVPVQFGDRSLVAAFQDSALSSGVVSRSSVSLAL